MSAAPTSCSDLADADLDYEQGVAMAKTASLNRRAAQGRRTRVGVKERPVVRMRDLPLAGRRAFLRWRKRRYACNGCGRTFTESHPELPPRQRVTCRFRGHLFERMCGDGARADVALEEGTTRYQVARAFKAGRDLERVGSQRVEAGAAAESPLAAHRPPVGRSPPCAVWRPERYVE